MKKLISTFAIATCAVSLMGCGIPQSQGLQKNQSSQTVNPNTQEIATTNAKTSKVEVVQTRKTQNKFNTELEALDTKSSQQTDTKTISNGRWTVTIANMNSWSGVNGTGNLSYHGCDSKGRCIDLTNGTVSCRNGICVMGWKNGDYVYAIAEPMSESTNPQPSKTTLAVRKGSLEILRETGFRAVR